MRNIVRRTAALVAVVALGVAGAGVAGALWDAGTARNATCTPTEVGCMSNINGQRYVTVDGATFVLCETEDAPGACVWIASVQGNGQGRSFLVADGMVSYLP